MNNSLLRAVISAAICALLLAGCAPESEVKQSRADIPDGSRHPNGAWIGKPLAELIEQRGEPESIIHATILGEPQSKAYLYSSEQDSQCIDAFLVRSSDQMIIKYFCR